MATVEKRSISLSSELASAVDEAVTSGEYGNASEVVRDALRQWKERRVLLGYTVEELRQLWQEGIESGDAGPFDEGAVNRIRERAHRRLMEERVRSG